MSNETFEIKEIDAKQTTTTASAEFLGTSNTLFVKSDMHKNLRGSVEGLIKIVPNVSKLGNEFITRASVGMYPVGLLLGLSDEGIKAFTGAFDIEKVGSNFNFERIPGAKGFVLFATTDQTVADIKGNVNRLIAGAVIY